MTSVHLIGRLRRRYVCFQCVGNAALLIKNPSLAPIPWPVAPPNSRATTQSEVGLEDEMSGFMQSLWERGATGAQEGDLNDSDVEDEGFDDAVASFGEERSRAGSILAVTDSEGFDGDALKSLLDSSHSPGSDVVMAVLFTRACSEIVKLLAGLGKAFEFASSDMQGKLTIMALRIDECARDSGTSATRVSVQSMVEKEIKLGTANAGKAARGAARTILRLLWFYDFVAVLLRKLADDPKAELRSIVSATYEETLAARHVWILCVYFFCCRLKKTQN